ncbi:MAG: small multi-drug export protein, partial [Clostridia bacterium]|nr:small multi-drug export protein [Clostridia bacterium]
MNEIIEFFRSIFQNDYLTLYVISIIPIIELRGAIVFMSGMFSGVKEMIAGMFCCVAGSTTVILPLILLVRPIIRRMKRSKWFSKIAKSLESSLADRAESAYSEEAQKQKAEAALKNGKRVRKPLSTDTKKFLGLFAFVAIPLPMT